MRSMRSINLVSASTHKWPTLASATLQMQRHDPSRGARKDGLSVRPVS
jgi:hypothetical protein